MKTFYLTIRADDEKKANTILEGMGKNDKYSPLRELEDNERIEIIRDGLDDTVEQAKNELKDKFRDLALENMDFSFDDFDLHDDISEISDGAVPIYTYDIKCLWFLYDGDFEYAYEQAGIGDNPRENNGMTAIFCYIEQALYEYTKEFEDGWCDFGDFCSELDDSELTEEEKEAKKITWINNTF